jgi:hypothetical protein
MKKQILLLAGSAIILASCGSNNNPAQTQAQIDSAVNAKLAQHDAENAAKNDSTLKAMEKEKAEAMSREHHGEKKHEGSKKEEASPVNTPPPPPPPPATGMRGHSDQSKANPTGTTTPPASGGMRSHSDQNTGK